MTLPRHSALLEKGPVERLPLSSIAYHPGLMPRTFAYYFIDVAGNNHFDSSVRECLLKEECHSRV